jgi:hypothetical protein
MFEPTDDASKLPSGSQSNWPRSLRWARLYYVPFVHCPALCPFDPPRVLFTDDYDHERESAVWTFCGARCPLIESGGRPCLERYRGRDGGGGRNGAAEAAARGPTTDLAACA